MTTNSGITKEWVDETVKPGDDFFRHVNGKWLATHEIPADRPKAVSYTHLTLPTNREV